MKAFTLWRPWPWAFIYAGKPLENRTWHLPRSLLGQRVALHAGKTFSADAAAWIEDTFGLSVPPQSDHPTGIVATAVYRGTAAEHGLENDPWYCGPVGWVFGGIRGLPEPVACRGAQGLWTVPEATARLLL